MNIYEFSEKIGLSIGTVSRAINDRPGVSAKTRAYVLERMKTLGYRRSPAAASLASGRTQTVALWTPGLASSYVSAILAELEGILEEDDHDLVVVDVERRRDQPEKLLDLARWPVDGILALDAEGWLGPVAKASGPPLVSMGVYAYPQGVDHVLLDLGEGVVEAVEHLVGQGCRRVAMFLPGSYNHAGCTRRESYRTTLARHGLAVQFIETTTLMRSEAAATFRELVSAENPPEAVLCFNDDLGIAAFRSLRDLGLRVPEDVLLVGCDGVEETRYLDPPLATIEVPLREMCRVAWGFLRDRIESPGRPVGRRRLAARFVPRPSACRPRG